MLLLYYISLAGRYLFAGDYLVFVEGGPDQAVTSSSRWGDSHLALPTVPCCDASRCRWRAWART